MNTRHMKTIRMSRAHGEAWLAGLRGGEYQQGKEYLCTSDGKYCCLGVLQVVLDGDVERLSDALGPAATPSMRWLKKHNIEFLTKRGNLVSVPYLPMYNMTATCANDSAGLTFAQIADAIEAAIEYT